ncbi:MAG: N-6 DNA methylase [bacterium]|nr:N-6 DNA methylase [bacterium]
MRYENTNKKKENGIVYTPVKIADYLASELVKYKYIFNNTIRILDPAVGSGELLIAIIRAVMKISNLPIEAVGYETDSNVCVKTQERLKKIFPDVLIEIRNEDFLCAVEESKTGLFDYVIANPPYVRTQVMGSDRAQEISAKLGLKGMIDIYYAFLVYAKNVLKDDGMAGYITSNKFLTIKSGEAIRNYILNNYRIHKIVDLGDTKLFSASVLPCIIVFSKGKTINKDKVTFTSVYQSNDKLPKKKINDVFEVIHETGCFEIMDGRRYVYQQGVLQSIDKGHCWNIISNDIQKWVSKVENNTWRRFSDIGKIRVGIKTTADNVFIGDKWDGKKSEIELLKPLITHRNAGQILANTSKQWKVLYTHTVKNGKKVAYNIEKYPRAKEYLLEHYEQLAGRNYISKAHRNWYEIWVPQNPESWKHRKIVFRDISEKPQFWIDESGAIVNGDCYWIDISPNVRDEVIYLALAVANSSFIEKYYDVKFNTKLYSGKRRYMSQYVEQFPIPFYDTELAQRAINLVKTIIAENSPKAVSNYKDELDEIVEKIFS